jgi:HEPN domain-containing protein
MQNPRLAEDYFRRATVRLKVLDTLYEERSWADVVRESQETVELALKGLLRSARVETPRVHDVSEALLGNLAALPKAVQPHGEKLAECSRTLRRDRELAFYGSEDLTPSDFYREKDAAAAREMAGEVVRLVGFAFGPIAKT